MSQEAVERLLAAWKADPEALKAKFPGLHLLDVQPVDPGETPQGDEEEIELRPDEGEIPEEPEAEPELDEDV
jgi:hypothetical protein